MNGNVFLNIVRQYKKCPVCGASHKGDKLTFSLEKEIITIECICGWSKRVNERNEEV